MDKKPTDECWQCLKARADHDPDPGQVFYSISGELSLDTWAAKQGHVFNWTPIRKNHRRELENTMREEKL